MKRKRSLRVLLSRARLDKTTRCWLFAYGPGSGSEKDVSPCGRFELHVEVSGPGKSFRTRFTIAYGDSASLNSFCAGEGLHVYARHLRKHIRSGHEQVLAAVEWARKSLVSMCSKRCSVYQQVCADTVGGVTVNFVEGYVRSVVCKMPGLRMWLRPDCERTWEVSLHDAHYLVRSSTDNLELARCLNRAIERAYVGRLLDVCKM